MNKPLALLTATLLSGCSLAPDFSMPDITLPSMFKEQPPAQPAVEPITSGMWGVAQPSEQQDRGAWWSIFGNTELDELEKLAFEQNPTLQAAYARVTSARAVAETVSPSIFPDLDIGGNAIRSKPANAGVAAFGGNAANLKPYTLYSVQGVASYEADLFGRVRDNYKAAKLDAEAQEALYRSTLLALQADVAQHYFLIRALDAERFLLRDTIKVREEAGRIMKLRFETGYSNEQDLARTVAELASTRADLANVDNNRAKLEHALAVLLGQIPSGFSFPEAALEGVPPQVPAGLPSTLLTRRPDISTAIAQMQAANARIGVARSAFFPRLLLSASGGFESLELSDLFKWSSRTWVLGQLAGSALAMPIFDSGRNKAGLDAAHANYEEAVANYRAQVLVAFRDVEDTLSDQRQMAEQSRELEAAASAAARTTSLSNLRFREGESDYFEVVASQRDSLTTQRASVQVRGQRFVAAVALIRALGGGWEMIPAPTVPAPAPAPVSTESPAPVAPLVPEPMAPVVSPAS